MTPTTKVRSCLPRSEPVRATAAVQSNTVYPPQQVFLVSTAFPKNQLMMLKWVINPAMDNMGNPGY